MNIQTLKNTTEFKTVYNSDSGVAEIIELLWGHPECTQYLSQILYGDPAKHKEKKEFPKDVATALIRIFNYHSNKHPLPNRYNDVWQHAREDAKR